MDKQFTQIIENMVNECLNSPALISLNPDQKKTMADQIRNHLYNQILFTAVDNLTDEQFQQIKDLKPDNPELAQKIQQFTSEMPYFLADIEIKLRKDVGYIKQNGKLPSQELPS